MDTKKQSTEEQLKDEIKELNRQLEEARIAHAKIWAEKEELRASFSKYCGISVQKASVPDCTTSIWSPEARPTEPRIVLSGSDVAIIKHALRLGERSYMDANSGAGSPHFETANQILIDRQNATRPI